MTRSTFSAVILLAILLVNSSCKISNRIQPSTENPRYWQYKDKPVLLLGASNDDNLFQWPQDLLIPHLNLIQESGANYVRNTMSDRNDKGFELYPFLQVANGQYDLNKWNEEYWDRFEFFLSESHKRNIIVQIEIWDRFDYSRNNWITNPYNPKNNINYSSEETGLAYEYPLHPVQNKQPFFFTTPLQRNNQLLLKIQNRFVSKLLSISLNYNHVLYCMDNETSAEEEWARYWAEFVLDKGKVAGQKICVTEMWDNWDLTSQPHKYTFDHPELYSFCDVSQNNQQKGQVHWDNFQTIRNYISNQPRPLNTVKTYGADGNRHGNTKNGLERWWRHVIGGAASARFHRPPSGLGLSDLSANSIKVAREIEKLVKFWELIPGNKLLTDREENEAYLAMKPSETYLVFFTNGGEVEINLSDVDKSFVLKWFDIRNGTLVEEKDVVGGKKIKLVAPGKLEWIALLH